MTLEEFENTMQSLKSTFGDKFFRRERAERIYRLCSHLYVDQFKKIVYDFIDHSRNAPLPGEFISAMRARGYITTRTKDPDYQVLIDCGHVVHSKHYIAMPACIQCLNDGVLPEITKWPYLLAHIPKELHEVAIFFQRQGNEKMNEYEKRTRMRLREILRTYGLISEKPFDEENEFTKAITG